MKLQQLSPTLIKPTCLHADGGVPVILRSPLKQRTEKMKC